MSQTENQSPPRLNIETAEWALQDMGVTLRWNLLLNEMEVDGLPECYSSGNAINILPVLLSDHLKGIGCKGVSQQAIDGVLTCVADKNRYNPIETFLTGGDWDGVDRIGATFEILGVGNDRHRTYIKKWLIQCVALGLNDDGEVGADGVFVLQGPQGCGKTSFFRQIVPNKRWFVEGAVVDMRDRDSLLNALGAWITELGELDATLKREQSAFKAFITARFNRIRRPYARGETTITRRTSFCGTVNPTDYLRDETGNRRFWTVPVDRIDKQKLFSLSPEWVAQLWYQVYAMYRQNRDGFRLTDEELEALQNANHEFEQPLPYEEEISLLLDWVEPKRLWGWFSAAEVAKLLPGVADARKVGKALARIIEAHPTPTKSTRTLHGTKQYFIPIKQFCARQLASLGVGGIGVDVLP